MHGWVGGDNCSDWGVGSDGFFSGGSGVGMILALLWNMGMYVH